MIAKRSETMGFIIKLALCLALCAACVRFTVLDGLLCNSNLTVNGIRIRQLTTTLGKSEQSTDSGWWYVGLNGKQIGIFSVFWLTIGVSGTELRQDQTLLVEAGMTFDEMCKNLGSKPVRIVPCCWRQSSMAG